MPHRALKDSAFDRLKEDRTITAAEATRNFGRLQEEVVAFVIHVDVRIFTKKIILVTRRRRIIYSK